MTGTKVLIVEDDRETFESLQRQLEAEGFTVAVATDGASALDKAFDFQPELIVLDIDLPADQSGERLDGLRVLELLREDSETPVLMLTGTTAASVKVFALTIGADDYVTKPFDSKELLARIRAILRRARSLKGADQVYHFRKLKIDAKSRRVWKEDREINLTSLEFDLLLVLATRPGWVFTRQQLIQGAWKFDRYGDERVVDTHIGHLRKKIEENPSKPELIVTVHGSGYRFEDELVEGQSSEDSPA